MYTSKVEPDLGLTLLFYCINYQLNNFSFITGNKISEFLFIPLCIDI